MTACVSRRALLGSAAASLLLPSVLRAAAPQPVDVRVHEGQLRGTSDGDVMRFLGVPFAAPPIGARRFLPPAPALHWRGTRDATRLGDAPIQADPPAFLHATAHDYLGAERSEDCLKLNIWAPAKPGRYPVLVWVHGGGNIGGAAAQAPQDGTAFARDGIVCVTIGYRVGALGFLELGGLLGRRYSGSGVNGLRDQVAALRWVRANIARFGGDPGRITLGGESAGAKNVVALLASPLTSGLVRSAIVESGGQTIHDAAGAAAVAGLFAQACTGEPGGVKSLPTMSTETLLRIQAAAIPRYDRPFPFRAITGTDVLPVAPITAFEAGAACDVRLLIGTNHDESVVFIDRMAAARPLAQHDVANREVAEMLLVEARYAAAYPELDPLHRRVRLLTAEEYGLASFRLAEAHRRCGAGTWAYAFDRPVTRGPFAGWVPHTAELPFVWDAMDSVPARMMAGAATPEALALRDAIRARWLAFIRGSAPWAAYDGSTIEAFDSIAHPARMDRAEYDLWTG